MISNKTIRLYKSIGLALAYLIIGNILGWNNTESLSLFKAIFMYSIYPIPGQLGIICAVAVMAYFLRRLLFY